uniref:Uncharacterized protein n=1 Tax=Anguilla anguilla TaxID=7936 RepID=A0A0E9V2S4_ANGAN
MLLSRATYTTFAFLDSIQLNSWVQTEAIQVIVSTLLKGTMALSYQGTELATLKL